MEQTSIFLLTAQSAERKEASFTIQLLIRSSHKIVYANEDSALSCAKFALVDEPSTVCHNDNLIVNNQQDVLIKRWPLVIINSTEVDSAIRYLQLQLTAPMPHSVWSFAIVLHKIGKAFTKRMLDEYEQGLESKPQSACFRVCEVLERKLTEAFLQQLQCLHTFSSIIWLHDGIWVAPPPAPATIEAINDHVCRTFNIDTMPPLFRFTKLQPSTPGEDQILPAAKFDSRPHPLGGTAIKKRVLVADAASAQIFDKQQERLQKRRKQFPWMPCAAWGKKKEMRRVWECLWAVSTTVQALPPTLPEVCTANTCAGYGALISVYNTKASYKRIAHLPLHVRSAFRLHLAPLLSLLYWILLFVKKKIAQSCIGICCNWLPRRLLSHLSQLAPRKIDGNNYTSQSGKD